MLAGMSEAQFLDTLLDSEEFKQKNPPLCGDGPPPPPPPPGGAIQSLTLSPNKRGFLLNGKPHTVASHGNVVTAIPGHSWQADIALQLKEGETYARLWHILAGDTQQWPWVKVGNKWDLTQFNEVYWAEKRAVMAACDEAGIILEVHIFDRGCGGNQADYKAYPWHPDNNVNQLGNELPDGGTGAPEFYALKPKTTALQDAYARKWVEEARPFKGVILEIDNEFRGDSIAWPRHFANLINSLHPTRLVAHSSLGHDLEAAYNEPNIDIVCKHFGSEGNNTRTLHDYLATHWKLGKLINIDEFANGLGNKTLLVDMCEEIIRSGGHFHIEDSLGSADGYGAARASRQLAASSNPPFYEKGPTGPPPSCPPELFRGISFYNASFKSQVWIGHQACTKQNQKGFPAGVHIAFDSTPMAGQNDPIPGGCQVVNTTWKCNPPVNLKTQPDEPFSMQATFSTKGSYTVTAKGAAGTKSIVVKVV